jgi:serine/threonine-protein phosphatase 2A catalytic subunit
MEFASSSDLDKWIEKLSDCKPLTEVEVKSLCEQVWRLLVLSDCRPLILFY